jgi:hypothetical protein
MNSMPKTNRRNRSINPRRLRIGDVVAIGWHDAISMDRVDWDELDDIEDPEMTRCWGAVVRKSKRYLYIASEIGDSESDSMWVEALPFRLIEECRIIDKTEI